MNAPPELREELEALGDRALMARCAALRRTAPSPRRSARRSARCGPSPAENDRLLDALTSEAAPLLREAFGIGPDVAAEMLIILRQS